MAKYQYKSFEARRQKLWKNYNHKRQLQGKPTVTYPEWTASFKPRKVLA